MNNVRRPDRVSAIRFVGSAVAYLATLAYYLAKTIIVLPWSILFPPQMPDFKNWRSIWSYKVIPEDSGTYLVTLPRKVIGNGCVAGIQREGDRGVTAFGEKAVGEPFEMEVDHSKMGMSCDGPEGPLDFSFDQWNQWAQVFVGHIKWERKL